MQNFLKLSDIKRRTVYEQVALRVGISDPRAIEKDMWVSSLLQIIFGLTYADKFVFKGGSSLSKIWKLIHRFSEDIDLAIDRSLFGLDGDLTKKQLKKLRKESSLFVKDKLSTDIKEGSGAVDRAVGHKLKKIFGRWELRRETLGETTRYLPARRPYEVGLHKEGVITVKDDGKANEGRGEQ